LVGTKQGKPVIRATAKRTTFRFGPIDLAGKDQKKPGGGFSMDPKGQGGILSISKGLPTSATILAARWALTYQDGSEASPKNGGVYIHHMVSFDGSNTGLNPIGSCSDGSAGGEKRQAAAYFIDRGEDSGDTATIFTSPDGKRNSGFHFKNPRLTVQYDVVNYENTAKKIYIDLDLEYLDGIVGENAGSTLKSVGGCGVSGPKLSNNGPAVTTSKKLPVLADATIIWARGHLHAGGDKMILRVNGKDTCVSSPTYDGNGVITHMSLCPDPIKVKKGDYIVVESVYDLSKHKLRASTDGTGHAAHGVLGGSDVMGMFAMSYAL